MSSTTQTDWSGGADNLAPEDRLPKGFVRQAINVDPTPGGQLHLRSGYERVYTGAAVRGVLALGDTLLLADGMDLVEFDTRTNSARVLRQIAGSGQFIGDVLNDRLYFQTANEALEYDGSTVRSWGVPDVNSQPLPAASTGGSLLTGLYKMAVTFSDADGREGGTDAPLLVTIPAGGVLDVELPAPPAGGRVNLYVGHPNSQSLYLQDARDSAGAVRVTALRDDTRILTNAHLRAPQIGRVVRTHFGQLAIASGKTVWLTAPMRPHLVDRRRGFFQFPAEVGELLSAGSLFVSADKSYGLRGVESDAPEQYPIHEFPALPGSAVTLPDGRGAWMTKYGQAISTAEGGLELVNRANFAPDLADAGAAGLVEHNGNQLIVTANRGSHGAPSLAASDFFTGRVVRP